MRPRTVTSAERWSVLQAAVAPETVHSPLHAERRARAKAALEDLAVVAHRLHHAHRPAGVEAEAAGDTGVGAEQSLNGGIAALRLLLDVRLRDAELLRFDECM